MKHKCNLAPPSAIKPGTKRTVLASKLEDLQVSDYKTIALVDDPADPEKDLETMKTPTKVQRCPFCGMVMIE